MDSLNRLIDIFAHFPGIGPRQAKRFAYYILGKPDSFTKDFIKLIQDIRKSAIRCNKCQRLFIKRDGLESPMISICATCSDPSRDQTTLMVVARDSDFESIEKSGAYKGLYFILGGTVPVLDKEPENRIRLKSLLERISSASPKYIEIVLSLNTTPDGEHTETIVHEAIIRLQKSSPSQAKITVLGRGLSTGAELEYADSETIKNALKNRQ